MLALPKINNTIIILIIILIILDNQFNQVMKNKEEPHRVLIDRDHRK